MKLTIEQKAKRYDEAIEIARKIKNGEPINASNGTVIPDVIFPELKEDEDEKIRKWLIGYFNQYIVDDMPQVFSNGLHVKDIISWLEKQGKKESVEWSEKDEHKVKDIIYFLNLAKVHYASDVELNGCIKWLWTLLQRMG